VFFGDWEDGMIHPRIDGFPYYMQPKNGAMSKCCWATPKSNNPTRSDAQGFEYILEVVYTNSNLKIQLQIDTLPTRPTSVAFNNVKISILNLNLKILRFIKRKKTYVFLN